MSHPGEQFSAAEVLRRAARIAGIDISDVTPIRDGSHAIFELPGGIVARVGPPNTYRAAQRELRISQWLNENGIEAIAAVDAIPQPTLIYDRPVTWWTLIPDHRPSTPEELGGMLRRLHALTPPPDIPLPTYAPFDGVLASIESATTITDADRAWLVELYSQLLQQYDELDMPPRPCVIHGDAWQGNLVVPLSGGPVVLDLDGVSIGRREWDLIPLTADHMDFHRISDTEYRRFAEAYGDDITDWPGHRVLADIQELRWLAFALRKSGSQPSAAAEAEHRIACLRGLVPKPWTWQAL